MEKKGSGYSPNTTVWQISLKTIHTVRATHSDIHTDGRKQIFFKAKQILIFLMNYIFSLYTSCVYGRK